MPYLELAPTSRQDLLATADERWRMVIELRPELEAAVTLQRHLLHAVIELKQALDARPLPRLSLPSRYLAAKLSRAVPALAGEPIPLPVPLLRGALLRLCAELATGGAGEAALHIKSTVESGALDAGSLLAASLARDQDAIRRGAVHHGLAPDLVWLMAELTVSPFAHVLHRALFAPASAEVSGPLAAALGSWNVGYCPACGSWPALAEVVDGHRTLRCSFCAAAWELTTYACVYCGEEGEGFVTAAPDPERKDRRVEVCSNCGGYFKSVDVARLSPFPVLSIADLETMDLDVAAMEHGYARPALRSFRLGTKPG
jgi:FdhE protein